MTEPVIVDFLISVIFNIACDIVTMNNSRSYFWSYLQRVGTAELEGTGFAEMMLISGFASSVSEDSVLLLYQVVWTLWVVCHPTFATVMFCRCWVTLLHSFVLLFLVLVRVFLVGNVRVLYLTKWTRCWLSIPTDWTCRCNCLGLWELKESRFFHS